MRNTIQLIITTLLITLVITKSNAQFTQSSITDLTIQTHVTASHTGNDVLDDISGGDTYRVSVCDNASGNAPGLIYDVDYNSTNYQATDPFSERDAYDPDVCLVTGTNSVVYALAVYYSGNANGCVFDVFEWTGSGFSLLSSNTFSSAYGNAVNIDSDNQRNFVIIFDDGIGDIYTCGGVAGTGPSIAYSPVRVNNTAEYRTDPDVCIYQDGGSTKVYMSYIDNTTVLVVRETNLGNATGNSAYNANFVTTATASTNYVFETPRIACGTTTGNSTDFTVVYLQSNRASGFFYINGITRLGASFITHIYNDITSYADLHTKDNINPVVAYDSRSSYNIWVGWSFNDNGTPINSYGALYPIVLKCNSAGDQVGGSYWEVPDNITSLSPYRHYDILSLAGRWSDPSNDKLLLSFYNGGANSILEKEVVPSTATSLRIGSGFNPKQTFFKAENSTDIELYNITGMLVYKGSVSDFSVRGNYQGNINQTTKGLYLYRLYNRDKELIKVGKQIF